MLFELLVADQKPDRELMAASAPEVLPEQVVLEWLVVVLEGQAVRDWQMPVLEPMPEDLVRQQPAIVAGRAVRQVNRAVPPAESSVREPAESSAQEREKVHQILCLTEAIAELDVLHALPNPVLQQNEWHW